MKNIFLILLLVGSVLSGAAQVTTQPSPPEANAPVTIFFNKTGTNLASYNGTIYAHIGLTVNGNSWQNVIGEWADNSVQPALTFVSGTTYKLEIAPDLYTFFGVPATSSITQINFVFRTETGNAQYPFQNPSAEIIPVGAFQANLTAPLINSTTILNSGQSLLVSANNTGGAAQYDLLANGVSINTANGSSYSFTDTNLTQNKNYELRITQGETTFSKRFSVLINPGVITATVPPNMKDGINYDPSDATKATLVLTAPNKDFVYVSGNFNNYNPTAAYAMKKSGDHTFWLDLTGLTPNTNYTYQYWVGDVTNVPAGSPNLVKTADPYSTLVINPYDDPYIPAASYPNMPAYPISEGRDITVLRTGQTPYNWQVTNFVKPKKEDLVVYELLVRDFDAKRSFQGVIDRIDYLKNLKINAIQLMPVMEFEGNESWGYNTSFHMALDKYYGTADKLKELVDLCHQNGIAVILDVALNHAFGRNPMVRMWMQDPDGDGWGDPSAENPYFNTEARHSYSVGSDFNHQSQLTQTYTKRVVQHWITEFNIDGFRWDLTKGFTQACTSGDDGCTNQPQADRIQVLKDYADYSWSLDPYHYAIFEHLGSDSEEQQWANYRINETPSKGVMMWGELTHPYTQLIEGYSNDADISRMGHQAHGFTAKRLMGYPESHDKERLIYSAITYGNANGTSPVLNNLNNALKRMSSIGAISLLIPGPKMIWHFAELGYDDSIFTCSNGTVNTDFQAPDGDCKLDTKPQEQWTNNWLGIATRAKVYSDWSRMIDLKINEAVFEGNYAISPDGNNIRQRVYVNNPAVPTGQLNSVVVLANFSVAAQNVNPSFPSLGTWYNLMDNTTINVTNATTPISIPSGEFRVYGNQASALSATQFTASQQVKLFPNPTSDVFALSSSVEKIEIYSIAGQLVRTFGARAVAQPVDVSSLESGVYFVKISDANKQSQTLKLIRQ